MSEEIEREKSFLQIKSIRTSSNAFIMKLKDKNYHDYQCSLECNNKRYEEVYNEEMGVDFMKFLGKLKQ